MGYAKRANSASAHCDSSALEFSALPEKRAASSLPAMDEIEIEVFRADDRASRGITTADIAELASSYDAEANPVPAVIGHPKSDSPAQGTIAGFRVEGRSLFARLRDVSADLVEKVRNRELINRSMAFFSPDHESNPTPGKLAPRHLGFLGGSAPGVPGMSPLKSAFDFDAEGDGFEVVGEPAEAVIFEAPGTPVRHLQEEPGNMDPKDKNDVTTERQQLDTDRANFEAERDEFNARKAAHRKASAKSRVAMLVGAGKVLPAQAGALELIFGALSDEELEFSADDKGTAADKLVAIFQAGPNVGAPSGRVSPESSEFSADDTPIGKAAALTARANELVKSEPGLTFEAAIERVSKEG
ncbi:MAG TPA: hypothetical protein PLV92_24025 [Pirellulaceae bacterium]|nr:hypothetical protein [Pirellulaceae bacterium]